MLMGPFFLIADDRLHPVSLARPFSVSAMAHDRRRWWWWWGGGGEIIGTIKTTTSLRKTGIGKYDYQVVRPK